MADPGRFYISGPSALGEDQSRFWSLLWLVSRIEFRLRYHGSLLGYAWSLLNPLLLFGVIYLFFSQVIKFGGNIEHYGVVLLLNIMLFGFFSEATNTSVQSLVSRERMLRTTHFPRIVIPLAGVITSMLTLVTGLPVAFAYILFDGVTPMWTWLLMPVIIALLFAVTMGVALILSTLYVTIRDVSLMWRVVSRALFYGSAVMYTVDFVPESWRWIMFANPIVPILTQARVWIIDPSAPSALAAGGALGLALSVGVFVATIGIGAWLFVRRAPRIAELL
ncbi:MAG: ABC transporter permease [Solirubrobacterales bacterium]